MVAVTPSQIAAPASALLQIEQALVGPGTELSPLARLVGWRLNVLAFCAFLRGLPVADAALGKLLAPGFATFLSHDFVSLITEEEHGLLPLLQRRLLLGDNLDDVISQLSDEHRQEREQARTLAAQCLDFASGTDADWPELCDALTQFAERQRRHLLWEDATILPLARDRLSAEDLNRWGADMDRRYRARQPH